LDRQLHTERLALSTLETTRTRTGLLPAPKRTGFPPR
jgi:hypothetical protein